MSAGEVAGMRAEDDVDGGIGTYLWVCVSVCVCVCVRAFLGMYWSVSERVAA